MKPQTSQISSKDIMQFWATVYFNPESFELNSLIVASVNRAYRDLNRTIHGLSDANQGIQTNKENEITSSSNRSLHNLVANKLTQFLTEYSEIGVDSFNHWHEGFCNELITEFSNLYKAGKVKFYYGQAQKWINMSLKYVFLLYKSDLIEDRDVSRIIESTYPFWHVPVDNIIQDKAGVFLADKVSWSRINNETYKDFQERFMEVDPNKIPMDLEFELFKKTGKGSKLPKNKKGKP